MRLNTKNRACICTKLNKIYYLHHLLGLALNFLIASESSVPTGVTPLLDTFPSPLPSLFGFFKTGFLCVALAVLELTL